MKYRRWLRLKMLKLMRLREDPKVIARGIALGVGVDFLPTFGFGVVFAYLFATIGRANRVAAVVTSLALKCFIVPFYLANIIVGRFFLGQPVENAMVTTKISFSFQGIKSISGAFFLGSIINTLVASVVIYFVSHTLIVKHRARKKKKH